MVWLKILNWRLPVKLSFSNDKEKKTEMLTWYGEFGQFTFLFYVIYFSKSNFWLKGPTSLIIHVNKNYFWNFDFSRTLDYFFHHHKNISKKTQFILLESKQRSNLIFVYTLRTPLIFTFNIFTSIMSVELLYVYELPHPICACVFWVAFLKYLSW